MSDQDNKDPVVTSSLSKPLFVSSVLLVLSMLWGLYDEMYTIRPWKSYQARFVKEYSKYLKSASGGEAALEQQIRNSPEYKKLDADLAAAEKAALPKASEKTKQINDKIVPDVLALNDPFQEIRSHIGSLTYEIEVSHSDSHKESLRRQIDELKKEVHKFTVPVPCAKGDLLGDEPKCQQAEREMTFQDMANQLDSWKKAKAQLLQENVEILK